MTKSQVENYTELFRPKSKNTHSLKHIRFIKIKVSRGLKKKKNENYYINYLLIESFLLGIFGV